MKARLAIFISLVLSSRAGWVEQAWQRDNSYRATQTMWATFHSLVLTQRIGVSNIVFTNSFLFNISPTNYTPSTINSTFNFTITDIGTNGVASNRAVTISDSKTLAKTNLLLNWRAQIKWDCTFATWERLRGSGSDSNTPSGVRFYTEDKTQLDYLKSEMNLLAANKLWISPVAFSNAVATTNYGAADLYLAFGSVSGSNRNVNALAGVGSSFYSYTPYVDLFYTNSPYRRVMTCTVTIATTSTNIITNTVGDCCGGTFQAIGTNRQRVVNICTNVYIDAGLDASAFGYYAFRRVITNYSTRLIVSAFNANSGAFGEFHNWTATHDTNQLYDYTKGVAFTNHQTATNDYWSFALYSGAERILVESTPGATDGSTNTTAILFGGGTNIFSFASPPYEVASVIDLRAAGQKTSSPGSGVTNLIYWSFNTGIPESPVGAPSQYLSFSATNWDGVIITTNTPSMADWPALVVASISGRETYSTASKGYSMDAGISALIWFYGLPTNAPNSFQYR